MTTFLTTLLIILSILVLVSAIYMIYLTKKNNLVLIFKYLDKVIWVVFGLIGLMFIADIIGIILIIKEAPLGLIDLIKFGFQSVLFFFIFMETKFLLSQFKADIIFDKANAQSILKLGKNFVLLTSIEIITGLMIATFRFAVATNKQFTLTFNITTFIYISIGFIFYIISVFYHKAIDVYEENQLTI